MELGLYGTVDSVKYNSKTNVVAGTNVYYLQLFLLLRDFGYLLLAPTLQWAGVRGVACIKSDLK